MHKMHILISFIMIIIAVKVKIFAVMSIILIIVGTICVNRATNHIDYYFYYSHCFHF